MSRSRRSQKHTRIRLLKRVLALLAIFIFLIIIQKDETGKSEPVYAESPSSAFSQSTGRHTNEGLPK